MHKIHNIVTDVCVVCLSVCTTVSLSVTLLNSAAARVVRAGSLGAPFAKLL